MVFPAASLIERIGESARTYQREIMGAGRRIADRSRRRPLGERAHGAVGANAGADIDAARNHRLHRLAAPLREEEVEDEAMLLEDAACWPSAAGWFSQLCGALTAELELILRLCAPSDAQRDRGDNQQSAVTERSSGAYGRRSAPIHAVSSVESNPAERRL